MSPRRAWRKWVADLSGTRTQIVVVVLILHISAWVKFMQLADSPEHVIEVLRVTAPVTISGLLAWAGAKTVQQLWGVDHDADSKIRRPDDPGVGHR